MFLGRQLPEPNGGADHPILEGLVEVAIGPLGDPGGSNPKGVGDVFLQAAEQFNRFRFRHAAQLSMLNLINQAYSGLESLISRDMETLGERVRRLRLEADEMTQDALAAQVPGMSASAISQLENGNSKGVKPENLLHLAQALGVSMHELVTGKPDPAAGRAKVASTRTVRHADPQEEKLLTAFRKLAPDKRAVVIALTALLAGCVSLSDIDVSKYEQTCARQCTSEYSRCVSGLQMTATATYYQCKQGMSVCLQTCPPR